MRRTSSRRETVRDTYQRRTICNIIMFSSYLYLQLYIYNLLAFCNGSPTPISTILRITSTFENKNVFSLYALGTIISYARDNQCIFLVHSVWWISSILGLQQGLGIHMDNCTIWSNLGETAVTPYLPLEQESLDTQKEKVPEVESNSHHIHPSQLATLQKSDREYIDCEDESLSTTEIDIHGKVIENFELFLILSNRERKAIGRNNRQAGWVAKWRIEKRIKIMGTQTLGIEGSEWRRKKAAGECQSCPWPPYRKRSHNTIDCFRWTRLEKGTALFPKNENYYRIWGHSKYLYLGY